MFLHFSDLHTLPSSCWGTLLFIAPTLSGFSLFGHCCSAFVHATQQGLCLIVNFWLQVVPPFLDSSLTVQSFTMSSFLQSLLQDDFSNRTQFNECHLCNTWTHCRNYVELLVSVQVNSTVSHTSSNGGHSVFTTQPWPVQSFDHWLSSLLWLTITSTVSEHKESVSQFFLPPLPLA